MSVPGENSSEISTAPRIVRDLTRSTPSTVASAVSSGRPSVTWVNSGGASPPLRHDDDARELDLGIDAARHARGEEGAAAGEAQGHHPDQRTPRREPAHHLAQSRGHRRRRSPGPARPPRPGPPGGPPPPPRHPTAARRGNRRTCARPSAPHRTISISPPTPLRAASLGTTTVWRGAPALHARRPQNPDRRARPVGEVELDRARRRGRSRGPPPATPRRRSRSRPPPGRRCHGQVGLLTLPQEHQIARGGVGVELEATRDRRPRRSGSPACRRPARRAAGRSARPRP